MSSNNDLARRVRDLVAEVSELNEGDSRREMVAQMVEWRKRVMTAGRSNWLHMLSRRCGTPTRFSTDIAEPAK